MRSSTKCRRVDGDADNKPDPRFESKRKEALERKIQVEELPRIETAGRKAVCQGISVLMSIRDGIIDDIISKKKGPSREKIFASNVFTTKISQPCQFVGNISMQKQRRMPAEEIARLDYNMILRMPVRHDPLQENYEDLVEATNVIGTKSGKLVPDFDMRKVLDEEIKVSIRNDSVKTMILYLKSGVFAPIISQIRDEIWFVKKIDAKGERIEKYLKAVSGMKIRDIFGSPTPEAYDPVTKIDPVTSTNAEPIMVNVGDDWFMKILEMKGILQNTISSY
jgi:hypothetical protein